MCYNYSVVRVDGAFARLFRSLGRVGIAAGALLLCAALTVAGGFCLGLEIEGLDRVSERELLVALSERGITRGARLSGLDPAEVRRAVNSVEGVAESSAEFRGTTLVIRVLERESSAPKAEGRDVMVSAFDAEITRVICSGGTPRVAAGDVVKRGDVLIEGAVYAADGSLIAPVAAKGEVYGRVSVKRVYSVRTGAEITRRTGRSSTVTEFKLFGLSLGRKAPPFAKWESETSEATLNAFLPITALRTTYFETETARDERTVDEIAEYYRKETLSEYVADAENVSATAHVERMGEENYEITVYAVAEREITAP